jgi:hypothetical protein
VSKDIILTLPNIADAHTAGYESILISRRHLAGVQELAKMTAPY